MMSGDKKRKNIIKREKRQNRERFRRVQVFFGQFFSLRFSVPSAAALYGNRERKKLVLRFFFHGSKVMIMTFFFLPLVAARRCAFDYLGTRFTTLSIHPWGTDGDGEKLKTSENKFWAWILRANASASRKTELTSSKIAMQIREPSDVSPK